MKWSWRIATIGGIGIYLHATFLLLLAWVVLRHVMRGDDYIRAAQELVLLVSLFTIVVLHELGHAFAAKRYGIRTRDITLLPIGGVARLERMPEDPRQELVVALAGPAVNVVLGMLCMLGIVLIVGATALSNVLHSGGRSLMSVMEAHRLDSLGDLPLVGVEFLAQLLIVNVILVAFNMLPAFPMDGGRVLRALLAMRTDYVRATQTAARIGQAMAVLFGLIGLFFNPFLVFIALFVWLGAAAEASMVETRTVLGGVPVREAMITEFQTVTPDDTLDDVARHIIGGFQQDFPVMQGEQVVGMLTRNDLLKALAAHGRDQRVVDVMQRSFQRAESSEMLTRVLERLQTCACHSLPVMDHGRLVGVIDMENLGEFIALRSALRGTGARPFER